MIYLLLLLLFSLVGSGNVVKAEPKQPLQSPKPMLAVSIAVPEEKGQRVVALSTADPHIDVVIRNVSDRPLEFYADDCSAGYDSLHLELLRIDDKELPQPRVVARRAVVWERNRIRTVTLEPGDVMVREVHFTKDEAVGGIPYSNFLPMKASDFHKIQMRAVLAVGANQPPSRLWTGSIASETKDYQVQQYWP